MTQYLILNNYDVEKLVCEENVRVKTEKCDIVICTEEYYANVILVKNLNKNNNDLYEERLYEN